MTSISAGQLLNDALQGPRHARHHPIVVRHFGPRNDFYCCDRLMADLGARIVAGALADEFEADYEHCNRLGLHDMATRSNWTQHELALMAVGEDEDTLSRERETED